MKIAAFNLDNVYQRLAAKSQAAYQASHAAIAKCSV